MRSMHAITLRTFCGQFLGAMHRQLFTRSISRFLIQKSGLRCVHQSVNSDGYTTSITISGTLQNVVNSVLLLESKNAQANCRKAMK